MASLVELATGRVEATQSRPNPQRRWGADILARVEAASRPGVLAAMQESVVGACNELLGRMAGGEAVTELTAAGNTVMEHLLLGVSPAGLARLPYRPAFREARLVEARDIGLEAAPGALLYTFPIIGGFVGGDAVAVLTALGLGEGTETALVLDIGTNSEIMLACRGELFAASAAAGPAFEAGGISCGMTAAPGAIEDVVVEGDRLRLRTVADVTPRGICGSGLVAAAAALVDAGVIEASGRIRDADEVGSNLSSRIRSGEDGNSFVLFRGAGGEVSLTQGDIRSLQVAKAAIRAGVEVLLRRAGVDADAVGTVHVAGAFGSRLRPDALAEIGLIGRAWTGRVNLAGDAALEGAVKALVSREARTRAERAAAAAHYVSLSGSAPFEREFIKHMDLCSG